MREVKGGRRLPALQALIVLGVVGLVAALAIPALATQGKNSMLRQNLAALALQARAEMVLLPDGAPPAEGSLLGDMGGPAALAQELRSGAAGRFVNPYSGSTGVVCGGPPPGARTASSPAVWITSDLRFTYGAFRTSQLTRSQLAGCLVIAFIQEDGAVSADMYYVDAGGRASTCVEHVSASR